MGVALTIVAVSIHHLVIVIFHAFKLIILPTLK